MNRPWPVRPKGAAFASFFMGGFECSSKRRVDGVQLDLISATGHERFARADYRALAGFGIRTVRDGLRWHLIETAPFQYDWGSLRPMLEAGRETQTQVIWDLCHYGWPEDLDIWSPAFVTRFAAFARAAAHVVAQETEGPHWFCPVNEISFWSWAGGEVSHMAPYGLGRSHELKRQLVRASLAARAAIRSDHPSARFLDAEPLIHVRAGAPEHAAAAEAYRLSQFEAYDMLSGRLEPDLGGREDMLDILGANFYPQNQWTLDHGPVPMGHHHFQPLRAMLAELHGRYGRDLIIAETGAESSARPAWLHYVCEEVQAAREEGVPVTGLCLYPVTDYPGWEDGRPCEVGLLGAPEPDGTRPVYRPLATELRRQATLMTDARPAGDAEIRPLPTALPR